MNSQPIFTIERTGGDVKPYKAQFTQEQLGLIYDALNTYPQWNDDENGSPNSIVMNQLYNLLEY
jgi:hypothetical protein